VYTIVYSDLAVPYLSGRPMKHICYRKDRDARTTCSTLSLGSSAECFILSIAYFAKQLHYGFSRKTAPKQIHFSTRIFSSSRRERDFSRFYCTKKEVRKAATPFTTSRLKGNATPAARYNSGRERVLPNISASRYVFHTDAKSFCAFCHVWSAPR